MMSSDVTNITSVARKDCKICNAGGAWTLRHFHCFECLNWLLITFQCDGKLDFKVLLPYRRISYENFPAHRSPHLHINLCLVYIYFLMLTLHFFLRYFWCPTSWVKCGSIQEKAKPGAWFVNEESPSVWLFICVVEIWHFHLSEVWPSGFTFQTHGFQGAPCSMSIYNKGGALVCVNQNGKSVLYITWLYSFFLMRLWDVTLVLHSYWYGMFVSM